MRISDSKDFYERKSNELDIAKGIALKEMENNDEVSSDFCMKIISKEMSLWELIDGVEEMNTKLANRSMVSISEGCMILKAWDELLSSPDLDFDWNVASRPGSVSSYPLAVSKCSHKVSIVSFQLDNAPSRNSILSIGLCTSAFLTDGAYSLGEVSSSWGIVDKRNNLQPANILENGIKCGQVPTLCSHDIVSLVFRWNSSKSQCDMYVNNRRIHIFENLPSDCDVYFGCTLSEDQMISIVSNGELEEKVNQELCEADSSRNTDKMSCCICLTNPKNTVLLPCKHLCVCVSCGAQDRLKHCPICRERIADRMTVFT